MEPLKSIVAGFKLKQLSTKEEGKREKEKQDIQKNIQIRATAWSQELYFDCHVFTDSPRCWKGDNSLQSVLPQQFRVQSRETESQNASRILQKGAPASLHLLSDPLAHFTKTLVLARLLQQLSQFSNYRQHSTTTKSCVVFQYFDALVELRVGQGCSWLEKGHREAAATLLYTWEPVGLWSVKLLQASRTKTSSAKTRCCVNTNSCKASIPWIYVFIAPASSKSGRLILPTHRDSFSQPEIFITASLQSEWWPQRQANSGHVFYAAVLVTQEYLLNHFHPDKVSKSGRKRIMYLHETKIWIY